MQKRLTSRKILPSQTNDLFRLIEERGLDPAEFEVSIRDSETGSYSGMPTIAHNHSDFYFTVIPGPIPTSRYASVNGYGYEFAPGAESFQENGTVGDWVSIKSRFVRWLEILNREVKEPELWDAFKDTGIQQIVANSGLENSLFSHEEQLQLIGVLGKLEEQVQAGFELDDATRDYVSSEFEYLRDAVARLGKRDWAGYFISSLVGIIVSGALPASAAKHLFQTALQATQHFLNNL